MSNGDCPPLAELFSARPSAAVGDHVRGCPRCQTLLAEAGPEQAPAASEPPSSSPTAPPTPVEPLPVRLDRGTIAVFSGDGADRRLPALVLDGDGPLVHVAPVSDRVEMAGDRDLLLPQRLLGYPASAALWEVKAIRLEQFLEARASLSAELGEWVERLRSLDPTDEPPPEAPVGMPILAERDPRRAFQRELVEERLPFWRGAQLLGEQRTLGGFLSARRDALGVNLQPVAEMVEEKGWLESLECDRLDIYDRLPVAATVALFKKLEIPPLHAVLELLRSSVESTTRDAPPQGVVFARRRTGSRRPRGGPDLAERRRRADRYVGKVMESIQER